MPMPNYTASTVSRILTTAVSTSYRQNTDDANFPLLSLNRVSLQFYRGLRSFVKSDAEAATRLMQVSSSSALLSATLDQPLS